jgi:hypothetical protein
MASSGDKKLAHSAHMFHFQHQKQQVIALERFVISLLLNSAALRTCITRRNKNRCGIISCEFLFFSLPPTNVSAVIPDAIDAAPIRVEKATKITKKETTLFTSVLD